MKKAKVASSLALLAAEEAEQSPLSEVRGSAHLEDPAYKFKAQSKKKHKMRIIQRKNQLQHLIMGLNQEVSVVLREAAYILVR